MKNFLKSLLCFFCSALFVSFLEDWSMAFSDRLLLSAAAVVALCPICLFCLATDAVMHKDRASRFVYRLSLIYIALSVFAFIALLVLIFLQNVFS